MRRSRQQRDLRERRDEKAFVFDKDVTRCLGEFERDDWELAISARGGDVPGAAAECGAAGIPRGAKALWGRSAQEAAETYRRWQKRKGTR